MLPQCIQKVINELHIEESQLYLSNRNRNSNSQPPPIDVVFGYGVFNGSYLHGAAYFLQAMEDRGWLQVRRISGSSIGAYLGLLYLTRQLDIPLEYYGHMVDSLREHHCLKTLKTIFDEAKKRLPADVCQRVNGKLFVSYHDISRCKKVTLRHFRDVDHLMDCIYRSCFVPYLINGEPFYRGRYLDGILPYVFPHGGRHHHHHAKKHSHSVHVHVPILYIDLMNSVQRLCSSTLVKNEKNNFHRVLTGLLDTHSFFLQRGSTMCSYVHDWSFIQRNLYRLQCATERAFVIVMAVYLYLLYFYQFGRKTQRTRQTNNQPQAQTNNQPQTPYERLWSRVQPALLDFVMQQFVI